MKKIVYILVLITLIITLNHCGTGVGNSNSLQGGSEAGNPEPAKFNIIGYSSSNLQQMNLLSLPANNLEIDVASIVLGRLEFRPFSFCEEESEEENDIRFEGPFIVDLLDNDPSTVLADVTIPPGNYCKIEIRLDKLESNQNPGNPINGNSVLIEGRRSDGVRFILTLDENEEFELENETAGFIIDPTLSIDSFFIAFDLDLWFAGVDLFDPAVEISSDGQGNPIIFIDDDNNKEIRDQILENLETSADLFEDENDDGDLDPEEQEESLAEGKTIP